jgi:predicted  nucleic acid-binding Zn-ribbon protein
VGPSEVYISSLDAEGSRDEVEHYRLRGKRAHSRTGRPLILCAIDTDRDPELDDSLRLILAIQSIDTRRDAVEREIEKIPQEIQRLRDDLDLLKRSMEQSQSDLEELKKSRLSFEGELEEVEIKLKKSRARLNDVKSNKEYQAVLKEIDELKALASEKEEVVITWMEDIEIQEKDCADYALKWEQSLREYENEEKKYSQTMKDFEREVHSLSDRRRAVSQEVDKELLARYQALRANLGNQVVVPVIDAVCQGCHLGIPPQQYNNLIRGGSLESCPNCNRIVYWEEKKDS